MRELELKIVTPMRKYGPFKCDSIHITVCDDLKGKGGGSYGLRHGGLDSVYALEEGKIEAFLCGEKTISGKSGSGFATDEENSITVAVEYFKIDKED